MFWPRVSQVYRRKWRGDRKEKVGVSCESMTWDKGSVWDETETRNGGVDWGVRES